MFKEDDKVVYPGHGVANVDRVVTKNIAGISTKFFELRFINKDMTVLVPVGKASAIGIRHLNSREYVEEILHILAEPAPNKKRDLNIINWNKRNKEYQLKLRTGNLKEISEIYRDLKHVGYDKELSFGEKTLLTQIESLLAEEISLIHNIKKEDIINQIRQLIDKPGTGVKQYKVEVKQVS